MPHIYTVLEVSVYFFFFVKAFVAYNQNYIYFCKVNCVPVSITGPLTSMHSNISLACKSNSAIFNRNSLVCWQLSSVSRCLQSTLTNCQSIWCARHRRRPLSSISRAPLPPVFPQRFFKIKKISVCVLMIAEDNEMTIKVTCRPTPAAKRKKTCMQICAKKENESKGMGMGMGRSLRRVNHSRWK